LVVDKQTNKQTNKQNKAEATASNEHTNNASANMYRNWKVTGTAIYWQNKCKGASVSVIRRQFGLIAVQPNDSLTNLVISNMPP